MAVSKSYKEAKEKAPKNPALRKEYEALSVTPYIPYSTDNTDKAAFLLSLGGKYIGLDRSSDDGRVTIMLELTEEQFALAPRYDDGSKVLMSPLANTEAKRKLVRLIKNG